jgi:hypothetical protein
LLDAASCKFLSSAPSGADTLQANNFYGDVTGIIKYTVLALLKIIWQLLKSQSNNEVLQDLMIIFVISPLRHNTSYVTKKMQVL